MKTLETKIYLSTNSNFLPLFTNYSVFHYNTRAFALNCFVNIFNEIDEHYGMVQLSQLKKY